MSDGPSNTPFRQEVAALLMRHTDTLYGYILACVRNQADADDVLQNVAVAVVATASPPTNDADFLRWAREIARRRVLEFRRNQGRTLIYDPALIERLAEAADWVDQNRSGIQRREALLTCVEKLAPQARELLLYRYGESSVKIEHLAARFGKSLDSITSLLYRVRQSLRACVERRLAAEGHP